MSSGAVVVGATVALRKIEPSDFGQLVRFEFSVSIVDPHASVASLERLHAETAFWTDEAAALAIVDRATGRLVGTLQCYRSAPCIHGLELGYVIHDVDDRGKGYAAEALRLFSDHLFEARPTTFRQQLIIEVWNTPSWKVAERSGFVREGVLRSCGFGSGDPADCFVYSRTRKDWMQELASQNGAGAS
jgi:RimJ/RimL family protein N-acetyltransferase